MHIRPLKDDDIPTLREFYERQGFDYAFPDLYSPLIETVQVVVDQNDTPLCAVAAERTVQLYFLAGDFGPVHARMYALRLLHERIGTILKARGFDCVTAYIPPSISEKFGKWLIRRFGWSRNWPSFDKRF